jgi:hypothetical protein
LRAARETPDVRFAAQNIQGPVRAVAAFLAAAVVAVVAPGSAEARLLKRLDYDSGNFGQWFQRQALPGGAKVIRSPRIQGRYAARFLVGPGDDPLGASGERAEVMAYTGERSGKVSWWKWSTLFPRGFTVGRHWWNVFTQWHHSGDSGIPPIQFAVDNYGRRPMLRLIVNGGHLYGDRGSFQRDYSLGPLRRGRWLTFVFHVKWSPQRRGGFVEVWRNGRKVVGLKRVPTLYYGRFVYVKQGFYRGPTGWSSVVYHDGMRRFSRKPALR